MKFGKIICIGRAVYKIAETPKKDVHSNLRDAVEEFGKAMRDLSFATGGIIIDDLKT